MKKIFTPRRNFYLLVLSFLLLAGLCGFWLGTGDYGSAGFFFGVLIFLIIVFGLEAEI